MRKAILVAAVCAVALPAVALAARQAKVSLDATLSGLKEAPKASATGKGYADIDITGGKVCWKFTYSGIGAPKAAHIHRGKAGVAGPVVVPLGAAFKKSGCTTAPAAVAAAIVRSPGAYYVNIHTAKYPNGAIRGQLAKGD
jgi:hypothetical protein